MARQSKQYQTFTVRLRDGTLLGSWRAYTAKEAIGYAVREYAQIAATFRRSQPMSFRPDQVTASVEAPRWPTGY